MLSDITITTALLFIAILGVCFLILENSKSSDLNNGLKEHYAPVIDDDFDQYAPAYDPNDPYQYYMIPSVGWLSRRGLLPWWNSTRDTTNMSYDIRGDIPPVYYPVGPWLNPEVYDHPYRFG